MKDSSTIVSTRLQGEETSALPAKHWYAIRCTYGREKRAYDYFVSLGIEAYYPTVTTRRRVNGEMQVVTESRLPNLFFAYDTLDSLKQLVYNNAHVETRHLRFYCYHHRVGTHIVSEPLIIPDDQMTSLRIICASEAADILVQPETIPTFLAGQRVRVCEGAFAGVEGIVARFRGQQRVGITIPGLLSMVTAYIPTAFLEPVPCI